MYRNRFLSILCASLLLITVSCDDDSTGSGSSLDFLINDNLTLNPSGYAPLSALLNVSTEIPVSVEIRVESVGGQPSNILKRFDEVGTDLELPVLGLFPNVVNTVRVTFFDQSGGQLGSKIYEITTQPLIRAMPDIAINGLVPSEMVEGMTFVSYFGHTGPDDFVPQRPFMFDRSGIIRWYLDFSDHPVFSNLFYDNGMERLQNGNLYFGDGTTNRIYEIDMFGEIVNQWDMPGYGFHHNVIEKPDGNFVVTVNKLGEPTVEDYIIEIDRNSGAIIREWNLNESLDNQRRAWPTDLADLNVDWFHANALWYDESDNTIVVSGRTQGVVKLTENNGVVWIIAPHREWASAGNGQDLTQFLLQPLDETGQPITDPSVLEGESNHPDFEWAWYQHAPQVLPNGNILLFDNGDNRNYSFTGFDRSSAYSRAVEYEIDETNMTIRQVWQFGKELGSDGFSRIVSDVDFFPGSGHVFFSSGSVLSGSENFAKVFEIDRNSDEVIFEATIRPPFTSFNITLHRTERMTIYPN